MPFLPLPKPFEFMPFKPKPTRLGFWPIAGLVLLLHALIGLYLWHMSSTGLKKVESAVLHIHWLNQSQHGDNTAKITSVKAMNQVTLQRPPVEHLTAQVKPAIQVYHDDRVQGNPRKTTPFAFQKPLENLNPPMPQSLSVPNDAPRTTDNTAPIPVNSEENHEKIESESTDQPGKPSSKQQDVAQTVQAVPNPAIVQDPVQSQLLSTFSITQMVPVTEDTQLWTPTVPVSAPRLTPADRMATQGATVAHAALVVTIRALIDQHGNVVGAEIAHGSGDTALDETALATLRHMNFAPILDAQQPVAGYRLITLQKN